MSEDTDRNEDEQEWVHKSAIEEETPGNIAAAAQSVFEYWTPQRMQQALPIRLPEVPSVESEEEGGNREPGGSSSTQTREAPTQEIVAIPPVEAVEGLTSAGLPWTGPAGAPPRTTTGKLFLNVPGGPATGSAAIVDSPAKNLIFTAAHCLHSGGPNGQWFDDFALVPGYNHGQVPHGRWVWKEVWVPGPWFRSGDKGWDVGAILVWPDSAGRRIADVLGANGIIFNAAAEQDTHTFGYPGNFDNGESLHFCNSRSGWKGIFDPRRIFMRSDFLHGSSGGPWLMNFNGRQGRLHSVISTGNLRGEIHGILFDNSIKSFYDTVKVRF